MGDMADYSTHGYMDPPDWYFEDITIKCKFCKKRRFHWHIDEAGRWRLYTPTGKLHRCKAYFQKEKESC